MVIPIVYTAVLLISRELYLLSVMSIIRISCNEFKKIAVRNGRGEYDLYHIQSLIINLFFN